jgi:DNA-binding transcriptional MocR family regulator
MLPLNIRTGDCRPLVEQIVGAIRREIDERHLRPGTRIPSIRGFAQQYRVSRFTVVEAYDRLVAMGYLHSRRGAGFYAQAPQPISESRSENRGARDIEQLTWMTRRMSEAGPHAIFPGGGWLPHDWHDQAGIRQSLNALARKNGGHLVDYGNPYGYLPLREHLCVLLGDIGINVQAPQILLTAAASQALDLLIRLLLKPGDTALVDDPGYYNLFGILRLHGVQVVGVPRKPDGPDVEEVERLAAQHQSRIYFTQTAVQNPTSTTTTPHVAYRVLQVAERCNLTIVEDDVCSDLQRALTPRLATLDQLNRVIYVRSFTKTMSGSMRVGFVASRPELIDRLADIKMLTSITTSEFTERLIYQVLVDGHYRKHLARLWGRLDEARHNVIRTFERIGVELFSEPADGLYLWARFPTIEDTLAMADRAASQGFVLAPGSAFSPQLDPSPWMRFNVALSDNPLVHRWFEQISTASGAA